MPCSLATVDIFLSALCSYSLSAIHYCSAPFLFEKSGFLSYRDNYDAVLYCELILCVQMFMETWKNFLPRALLIENGTDPGMPYNSAEIMNIKNFSEGQICIKGWKQSEIC